MGNCSLQEAHEMAVSDQWLLRDDLAQDIVILCDLKIHASLLLAAVEWITHTLGEAAGSKMTRTDSSLS